MLKTSLLTLGTIFCFATPAFAQIVVHGGGKAKDCYDKTKRNDPGHETTLKLCEEALKDFNLSSKNEAATHVNIAILRMRRGDYSIADMHYNKAIALRPKVSEAYISLSANHIYQGEYDAAVKAVNIGIDLGTDKLPEALYNRAMAYDRLEKYSLAYKDLKRALSIRPDWDAAIKAIGHYEVVSQPG